jgi:hypothetical protein
MGTPGRVNDLDLHDDDTLGGVLSFLAVGSKDATAARELGMSVRTYRRHVAEIMRRLDAVSRFQAGVRAMELGLVGDVLRGAT